MAGWDDILSELRQYPNQYDSTRRKYLEKLSNYTRRNVIAYYSAWLIKRSIDNLDINDMDMNGFMNAMKGTDCSKGLDLILHTPGGDPVATEAIVSYLRNKFNKDLRVIVPQLAMSAGTMMACAAKEIIMGKHSSLGPIDPQFNQIPAYNIRMEFEEAMSDLQKNPQNAQYWAIKLQQYPAAFLKTAIDAIELSDKLAEEWLGTCMFDKSNPSDKKTIRTIVDKLNDHDDSKAHSRHFDIEFCKGIGLKIESLEDNPELQDLVLSVHHVFIHTLANTPAVKIIENQNGKTMIAQSGN